MRELAIVVFLGLELTAFPNRDIAKAGDLSWREGIRHLFLPRTQRRFCNCLIRFTGKRLTKQICKAVKPHLKALEGLEQWKENFRGQFEDLHAKLIDLAESLSGDMAQRKDKFLEHRPGFAQLLPFLK